MAGRIPVFLSSANAQCGAAGAAASASAQSSRVPQTAVLIDMLPIGGSIEVKRALCAYFVVLALAWLFLYFFIRIRAVSAIVVALAFGQIIMNLILIPTNLGFWNEFDSYVGLYGLVQVATPFAILVYAVVSAFSDKRPRRPAAVRKNAA
jgi:uncharacterized membrane protein